MADGSRRTAQEREEARREREAARAARDASQRAATDSGDNGDGDERARPSADEPMRRATTRERPARRAARCACGDARRRRRHPPTPDDDPAATGRSRPRTGTQPGGPPIKSFPSPPDPDFYLPEDELEMPSGTKRVSRLGNRQRPVRARPARRRHQVKPRKRTTPTRRRPWLVRIVSLLAIAAGGGAGVVPDRAVPAVRHLTPWPRQGRDPAELELQRRRQAAACRPRDLLELLLRAARDARRRSQRPAIRAPITCSRG